jgi:hypothetical protein
VTRGVCILRQSYYPQDLLVRREAQALAGLVQPALGNPWITQEVTLP